MLFGAACGGGGGGGGGNRDAPGPRPDAPEVLGGCSDTNRDACAYVPERTYEIAELPVATLSYDDVLGIERTFRVLVRRPVGAPLPMPIVIWSHGGNDGRMDPTAAGIEWSETFARAGYVVVTIAHAPRPADSLQAVCDALGITVAADCERFKYLHHDRPYDVRRVIDWLEEQEAGDFAGVIDLDRILHAGHSAGAGGGSVIAGATRDFNGFILNAPDPRPRAFVGLSVEGPMDDGFTDGSYVGIDRPHLTVTGVGDTTPESDPAQRRRVFELEPAGDKYRLWITTPAAQHGTFDLNPDPCRSYQMRTGEPVAYCEEIYPWLVSAVLAFTDAQLRDRPEAIAWLASDNAEVFSGAVAEWDRR
jgi:predicted dienelactone hydrolase